MNKNKIEYTIFCGNSRRKLSELRLTLGPIQESSSKLWLAKASCTGYFEAEDETESVSEFDSLIMGLTFLRQQLREMLHQNPKIRFYVSIDNEMVERTIEDIFFTYDCVSDEMQEMIHWAGENGFQPE